MILDFKKPVTVPAPYKVYSAISTSLEGAVGHPGSVFR